MAAIVLASEKSDDDLRGIDLPVGAAAMVSMRYTLCEMDATSRADLVLKLPERNSWTWLNKQHGPI